ncbi:MAG TPA: hypothetical protein VH230_13080 [Stellaceae bacterium]|nr:hypothetical protein [Stellaceae bacterium]
MHDVIGTRCDPHTNLLLKGMEYHHCCHSNLGKRPCSSGRGNKENTTTDFQDRCSGLLRWRK